MTTRQMSQSSPGSQASLGEFGSADSRQCEAIAIYTSRRCEHDALPGVPYCPDHYHLLARPERRAENRR